MRRLQREHLFTQIDASEHIWVHRHPQGGVVPLCARWKGQTLLPPETQTRPSVGCFTLINSALCVAKFWNSASAWKRHCKTLRIQFACPPQYVQQNWMCSTHIHEGGLAFRRLQQMRTRPLPFAVCKLVGCLQTRCKQMDRFACSWPIMTYYGWKWSKNWKQCRRVQNSAESASLRKKRGQERRCMRHLNVELY